MRKINSISRTMTLLSTLSVVYALLDWNAIMLAPLLTVVIPFRYMSVKGNFSENRKILRNLLIFNLVTFMSVSMITNKVSIQLFEIISNLLLVFIYNMVLVKSEMKREELQRNPQKLYDTIMSRITTLEFMSNKIDKDMETAKNEKAKDSMQRKKQALENNIDELRKQASTVKSSLDNNNTQGL